MFVRVFSHTSSFSSKNPYLAPVTVIRELHKGGDRSCMHVEMNIAGSKLNYTTGDHVAIFPVNDPQLVARIGELLQADLDTVISLTNVDGELGLGENLVALVWDVPLVFITT